MATLEVDEDPVSDNPNEAVLAPDASDVPLHDFPSPALVGRLVIIRFLTLLALTRRFHLLAPRLVTLRFDVTV